MFFDKLLTVSEAAKMLGISTSTLRRLEKENGIVEGYGLEVIYTPGGQRRYIFDEIQQLYTNQGFSGKTGFGEKPALLIRDFTVAFFEPHSSFSIQVKDQIAMTKKLIESAKESEIPVIFSKTIYNPEVKSSRLWCEKFPSLEILTEDSHWVSTIPEIKEYEFDVVSSTPYITALYKSNVTNFLEENQIDTIILAGVTTSGSIRATAVEGLQQGYKIIVAEEAVGDRNKLLQRSTLIDLNARYADVLSVEDILNYYNSIKN
ncbi:isochorismatase family protein [Virgibacillus ainsalahensis]